MTASMCHDEHSVCVSTRYCGIAPYTSATEHPQRGHGADPVELIAVSLRLPGENSKQTCWVRERVPKRCGTQDDQSASRKCLVHDGSLAVATSQHSMGLDIAGVGAFSPLEELTYAENRDTSRLLPCR